MEKSLKISEHVYVQFDKGQPTCVIWGNYYLALSIITQFASVIEKLHECGFNVFLSRPKLSHDEDYGLVSEVQRPSYIHNCDWCKFLGTDGDIDIYWCDLNKEHVPNLVSVIGRYGNAGAEYESGPLPAAYESADDYLKHAKPWYKKALERAEVLGLYDPVRMTAIIK